FIPTRADSRGFWTEPRVSSSERGRTLIPSIGSKGSTRTETLLEGMSPAKASPHSYARTGAEAAVGTIRLTAQKPVGSIIPALNGAPTSHPFRKAPKREGDS